MNTYRKLNNFSRLVVCTYLLLSLAGCADDPENNALFSDEYYDISGHFSVKASELEAMDASLRKTLIRPNDTEVVHKDDVDWVSELKPFTEVNLNRPAFRKGYSIDTTELDDTMIIIYTARDSSFDIKQVTLSFTDNDLKRLEAVHSKDNVYYYSEEILTFEDKVGYEIRVNNVMKAGKPVEFSIKGEIIVN